MLTIRVRATTAVAGMWANEEYDVEPTEFIEQLIGWGHLIWVDEPDDAVEITQDPVHPLDLGHRGDVDELDPEYVDYTLADEGLVVAPETEKDAE